MTIKKKAFIAGVYERLGSPRPRCLWSLAMFVRRSSYEQQSRGAAVPPDTLAVTELHPSGTPINPLRVVDDPFTQRASTKCVRPAFLFPTRRHNTSSRVHTDHRSARAR